MLLSVARNKFATGWTPDAPTGPAFAVTPVREALEAEYRSDAHFATYVAEGLTEMPRVTKAHALAYPHRLMTHVLLVDVDNPGHAAWQDELRSQFDQLWRDPPEVLHTCGVYLTSGGYRLVQPLAEPVLSVEVEPVLQGMFAELLVAGVVPDTGAKDWTRLMRAPNVVRDGKVYRTPFMDLSRMRARVVSPVNEVEDVKGVRAPRVGRKTASGWVGMAEIPESWKARVVGVAGAMRSVTSDWHTVGLALASSFLELGVDPGLVPSVVAEVSRQSDPGRDHADRYRGAQSTVERWSAGFPNRGLHWLEKNAGAVADAVRAASVERAVVKAGKLDVEQEIRDAALDAVTLIGVECGGGKTAAAIVVAKERAESKAPPDAGKKRDVAGVRTAISVNSNALAKQVTNDLRRKGVRVTRHFGPLSHMQPDGSPTCKFWKSGTELVGGGQSMVKELCEGRGKAKCPEYESCEARTCVDEEVGARVAVGTHALIGRLAGWAGKTGMVVVDEPPSAVRTVALGVSQIDHALHSLGHFADDYARAMAPVLRAVRRWLQDVTKVTLSECLDEDDARDAADRLEMEAWDIDSLRERAVGKDPGKSGGAPPLKSGSAFLARPDSRLAGVLGAASGTLMAVSRYDSISRSRPPGVADFTVVCVLREKAYGDVLRREGKTVLLDAGAKLHLPVVKSVTGYEPKFTHHAASDGAVVERTLFRLPGATRKGWLRTDEGGEAMLTALREVLEWTAGEPALVVSFRALWARADVRELIRSYAHVETAHFGSLRGKNDWSDHACIVTLGDPRQNIGTLEAECAELGIDPDGRAEDLARAELEQCHGRLRVVHRTTPCRMAHVGRLWPAGWGWTPERVTVVEWGAGRGVDAAAE